MIQSPGVCWTTPFALTCFAGRIRKVSKKSVFDQANWLQVQELIGIWSLDISEG